MISTLFDHLPFRPLFSLLGLVSVRRDLVDRGEVVEFDCFLRFD